MTLFLSHVRIFRSVVTLLLLLFCVQGIAMPPRWLSHLPKANNDTYYYVKASATATSEEVAYNKALGLVLQQSIMSLGLPFNSKQVEAAIKTGN